MTHYRIASLALVAGLLAASACGKSRTTEGAAGGPVTLTGGAVDGSDVTVESRWCTRCHGDASRAPTANDAAGVAFAPPRDVSGATTGAKVGAHMAHLRGSSGTPRWRAETVTCGTCHVVPANAESHVAGVALRGLPETQWGGAPVISPAYTGGSCSNTYCHGAFPGGLAATVAWNEPSSTAACGTCHGAPPASPHTASTDCGTCHAGYSSTTVNTALHIDGKLDVTEPTASSPGSSCGTCHPAIFAAMSDSTYTDKHTLGSASRSVTAIDWSSPSLTYLSDAPIADRSCVSMCHSDHPHDVATVTTTHEYNLYADPLTEILRAIDATPTTANRAKTDFNSAANAGMCADCHAKPIAAGRPAFDAAAYGASAHDYVTASGVTWQFALHSGAFDRNCTKCHASFTEGTTPSAPVTNSVHFSANSSLLAGVTRPGTAGANGLVCFNCHGLAVAANGAQGNRSWVDLQTAFAKAFDHPIAADTVHDTANERTATYNDGKFKLTNRHVNCLDCHDPHKAGTTLHAVGVGAIAATSPVYGATGVGFTSPATNWAATAIGHFTFKTTAATEYELCFKCHSSFAFGATPPLAATTPSGLAGTDVAQEFSTSNQSYHPVVRALPATDPGGDGSSRLAASQLVGWAPGQTMTCTDCHDADAASPSAQGPHGSAVRFMLAGSNRLWPYSTGTTPWSLGDASLTGLFCLNCHPNPIAADSNNLHREIESSGDHNTEQMYCVGCHIRIPHGGKVSRLILTTNAPARYQTVNVTPYFAAFQKSASGKDGYTNADFNTACDGEHADSSPSEAW